MDTTLPRINRQTYYKHWTNILVNLERYILECRLVSSDRSLGQLSRLQSLDKLLQKAWMVDLLCSRTQDRSEYVALWIPSRPSFSRVSYKNSKSYINSAVSIERYIPANTFYNLKSSGLNGNEQQCLQMGQIYVKLIGITLRTTRE